MSESKLGQKKASLNEFKAYSFDTSSTFLPEANGIFLCLDTSYQSTTVSGSHLEVGVRRLKTESETGERR